MLNTLYNTVCFQSHGEATFPIDRRKSSLFLVPPSPTVKTPKERRPSALLSPRRGSIAQFLWGAEPKPVRLANFDEEVADNDADYIGFTAPSAEVRDRFSVSATTPMGRAMHVVVVGAKKVGKTSVLRQVACVEDITNRPYNPTIDDTYQILLEENDRPREILIFHDTAGLPQQGAIELKRPYLQVADAFVFVFSMIDHESFNRIDLLKKFVDRHNAKEKREVPMVVLGNMCDLNGRKIDAELVHNWAARERVRFFEVSAKDRNSLVDFVHYLGQRHFHPIKESKFSLSKKLKAEKSNAIVMDF